MTLLPYPLPCAPTALLGILYEDKERQDFIFTIYHWWQAVAIFIVYLGSSLPMKVRLSGVGEASGALGTPHFPQLRQQIPSECPPWPHT